MKMTSQWLFKGMSFSYSKLKEINFDFFKVSKQIVSEEEIDSLG